MHSFLIKIQCKIKVLHTFPHGFWEHCTPEGCQNRTKFIEQPALWHPSGVRRVFNAGPGVSLRSTPGYSL